MRIMASDNVDFQSAMFGEKQKDTSMQDRKTTQWLGTLAALHGAQGLLVPVYFHPWIPCPQNGPPCT